jgi:SAM-dependent methyltransferase
MIQQRVAATFEALFGRPPEPAHVTDAVASLGDGTTDLTTIALQWVASQEMLERAVARASGLHLHFIHNARLRLVRMLLPAADRIIDLGGANAPLYRMGYPHPFRRLVMVDLPEGDRHAAYGKMSVERTREGGEIELHYGDMTRLDTFPDASFDLVWSGQSIEHIDRADGMRMCREAFRVLTPDGRFCLDTPNRLLTAIQTRPAGGGFIHPEHQLEYEPDDLRATLRAAGFTITLEKGICEMPRTVATDEMHYDDFVLGNLFCESVERAYIQYYECRKAG